MYSRSYNPVWFFNTLTGSSVDDTYWAFFLTNDMPFIPQAVYQTSSGTPWSNPIEFQPSGGLPNNLFFDPTKVYRIEIRQGNTQASALIDLIENYIPTNGSGGSLSIPLLTSPNIITNPQFSDIFFAPGSTGTTITVAGTYVIAPGWSIVTTGTGSTTVTQVAYPGNSTNPGNPPYALNINSTGWSSLKLIQTFSNNGGLFSNGAIAVSFDIFATAGSETVSVDYVPSTGTGTNIFSNLLIPVGAFVTEAKAVNVDPSNNTDTPPLASNSLVFTFTPTSDITIANIQFMGQSSNLPLNFNQSSLPAFQEQTYAQIVNQEFYVYRNSIIMQPKSSILTGWDFSLNPWQFTNPTITTVVSPFAYTADQTIIIQQNLAGSSIAIGQAGYDRNKAFDIEGLLTNNIFAMIQYIDPATISPYWNTMISSLVKAQMIGTAAFIPFKMRLIYSTSLPGTLSSTEPILSWAGTDPIFSSAWTAIAPLNDPTYTFGSGNQDYAFNGFQLPVAINATMTLGIVIYTTENMAVTSPVSSAIFTSVSLVPNQFAIETNPLTWDETLARCEYYYEKSYDNGVVPAPGTISGASELQFPQVAFSLTGTDYVIATPFGFTYRNVKRAAPTLRVYSPSAGTLGSVDAHIYQQATGPAAGAVVVISDWTATGAGTKGIGFVPANATALTSVATSGGKIPTGNIALQYEADSRLGT